MTRFPNMTTRNLADYTDEQIIREAFSRILDQQAYGYNAIGCSYRVVPSDPSSPGCAIGVMMTAEDYSPEFERKSVGNICYFIGVGEERRPLISAIQRVHDEAAMCFNGELEAPGAEEERTIVPERGKWGPIPTIDQLLIGCRQAQRFSPADTLYTAMIRPVLEAMKAEATPPCAAA